MKFPLFLFIMEKNKKQYWVYIIELKNGNYYTGYTNNLQRRYAQHLNGTSRCKYTRSFRPQKLIQCWRIYGEKGDALKVENFIKKKSRQDKDKLIENPENLKESFGKDQNTHLEIVPFYPNIKK